MTRTSTLLLPIAACILIHGCAATRPLPASAPFVHIVLFKAKAGDSQTAVTELVRDIHAFLAPLPTVKGIWVGSPAPTNTRPIVDANYDVGLMLLFEDQKGLQAYLDHPRHVEFARKHDTRLDVRVFDFTRGE